MNQTNIRALALTVVAVCPVALSGPARATSPVPGPQPPVTFDLSGEARVRYETLGGQFRRGGTGGDQLLAFRTLVHGRAQVGSTLFGLELQDSRASLDDAGTPLSTSIVNPLDVLQAYVAFDFDGAFGQDKAKLTLGRQTIDIGSRRMIERVDYANVILSYTGAYWRSTTWDGHEWHALAVSPTERRPSGRADLGDDVVSGDEEPWGRLFWGLHHRRNNAAPGLFSDLWIEGWLYGLQESDADGVPTPNRDYLMPGFRLYREPAPGRFDLDLEPTWRFGSRRATSEAADTANLDVSALFVHAGLGYTFEDRWRTRIGLDWDYTSGDDDPNDDRFDRFERLFGTRRGDLGNTSIHGPLTLGNLNAIGGRIEVAPDHRWDARIAYKAAFLASPNDTWVVAGLRDPSGASGDFIGHSIDARARYWIVPGRLRTEWAASTFLKGRFAREAPGAPDTGDTVFASAQFAIVF